MVYEYGEDEREELEAPVVRKERPDAPDESSAFLLLLHWAPPFVRNRIASRKNPLTRPARFAPRPVSGSAFDT